ncbi:MAG: outer membrane protein assembly factor BamE [Pseudomonadota bacterium]
MINKFSQSHPVAKGGFSSGRNAAFIIALAFVIVGCSPIVNNRGNLPDQEVVQEIQPGIHTRADVAAILGTPSTVATFDDRTWYYIGKQTERLAFFKPDTTDQQVLVVQFDQTGTVERIERFDETMARNISPVGRQTPTAGKELTFLEQLLGNVGRFQKEGQ